MFRAAPMLLVFTSACDQTLVRSPEDFGPFVVVSGRLDPTSFDGIEDPATFSGGVAWLASTDGELGVLWQTATLEPRLFGYAMEIQGPPDLGGLVDPVDAPPELRLRDTRIALGLPVLHVGAPPPLDREAMLDWALGTDLDVTSVFGGDAARAAATGHLLSVVRSRDAVQTLADHPDFVDEAPWCRWSELEVGLVLYRAGREGCDGWRSIAYAEEYQGVDMVRVFADPATNAR